MDFVIYYLDLLFDLYIHITCIVLLLTISIYTHSHTNVSIKCIIFNYTILNRAAHIHIVFHLYKYTYKPQTLVNQPLLFGVGVMQIEIEILL